MRSKRTAVRAAAGGLAAVGLLGWYLYANLFEPVRFPLRFFRGEAVAVTENLWLGPYPTEDELRLLRRQGVEALVSLLDPSMPFEAPLIERERALAEKLEIGFQSVPLSYLPSLESSENLARARALVATGLDPGRKTYVHCYLGRHRTGLLRRIFQERLGGSNRAFTGRGEN